MNPTLPPHDGPIPFVELMSLEKITDNTFRSTSRAYAPGKNGGAYGGHVYAQAVWAAAQTVNAGFLIHSVTGFFTLQGLGDVPFVYHVKTIRSGRSFCVRVVDATQIEGKGIAFTCTCSFKLADAEVVRVQHRVDVQEQYRSVLKGVDPGKIPGAFRFHDPRDVSDAQTDSLRPWFPGLQSKKIDMREYNKDRAPLDRRQLFFNSVNGILPPASQGVSSNLHACAHLYASDQMSLFIVVELLELAPYSTSLASLSHTVVFHTAAEPLSMFDESGGHRLFCQEVWTDRAEDGRGVHHSRIWDSSGRHIASTIQDGLMRLEAQPEEIWKLRDRLELTKAKI